MTISVCSVLEVFGVWGARAVGGSEVLCGYLHTVFQLFQGPGDGGDDQRLAEEDLGWDHWGLKLLG